MTNNAISSVQDDVKNLLHRSFQEAKERNPSFSLRMFARKLGIQAPVVSEVMNGKRLISRKLAEKILTGLKVDASVSKRIIDQFPEKQVREKRPQREVLTSDAFEVVSDWWYFAILSLSETENCPSDPKIIANRLNISESQAATAISTLKELDLLSIEKDCLRSTGKYLRFTTSVPHDMVKKHHLQGLTLAQKALVEIDLELREFAAITFKADPKLLNVARARLRTVRNELSRLMNTESATDVYRLQMQLFPLTHES